MVRRAWLFPKHQAPLHQAPAPLVKLSTDVVARAPVLCKTLWTVRERLSQVEGWGFSNGFSMVFKCSFLCLLFGQTNVFNKDSFVEFLCVLVTRVEHIMILY